MQICVHELAYLLWVRLGSCQYFGYDDNDELDLFGPALEVRVILCLLCFSFCQNADDPKFSFASPIVKTSQHEQPSSASEIVSFQTFDMCKSKLMIVSYCLSQPKFQFSSPPPKCADIQGTISYLFVEIFVLMIAVIWGLDFHLITRSHTSGYYCLSRALCQTAENLVSRISVVDSYVMLTVGYPGPIGLLGQA